MIRASLTTLLSLGCTSESGLTGLRLEPNARVPTAVVATWESNGHEGETFVEYGLTEGALDRRTPAGTEAEATALALTAGRTWFVRAVTVDELGERWESGTASVDVAAPPTALPGFTINDRDDAAIDASALIFVTLIEDNGSWIVGLNRDGEAAWWYESEGQISIPSIHPAANGQGLMFTHHSEQEGKPKAGLLRMSFDGVEQALTVGDGHHDVAQLPDGRIAWIRNENPTGVVLEGGATADLSVDTLVENDEGAPEEDAEVRFSFLDDYPHTPWDTCSHFSEEGQGGGADYTHANSVMYDPDRDALLVMTKNLDALTAVDRSTGSVLWQAGGRYGDLLDVDGDVVGNGPQAWQVDGPNHTWWSHSHMSHFWGDGFLVFDNGYHHAVMSSRVVEYAIDPEAHTLQKVWEFPSETGVFNPLLGDARRLPNGNTLVSWTISGMLTEITPVGEVVWRAEVDLGSATGRLVYVPDIYHVE
ncbi:hypothetical protein LBMAG42_24090 [Deltaproteobacteria bacterium]|nr:hypothetical protein LBMAG42_24090 [Deltaproteobacteria bacterium]